MHLEAGSRQSGSPELEKGEGVEGEVGGGGAQLAQGWEYLGEENCKSVKHLHRESQSIQHTVVQSIELQGKRCHQIFTCSKYSCAEIWCHPFFPVVQLIRLQCAVLDSIELQTKEQYKIYTMLYQYHAV